jgi:hypothetical protein
MHPRNPDTSTESESKPDLATWIMAGRLHGIASMSTPPLRFLHAANTLSDVKLQQLRGKTTGELIDSLKPGNPGALKSRNDGTVLEGHHRLAVLSERGVDIHALPREVIPRET